MKNHPNLAAITADYYAGRGAGAHTTSYGAESPTRDYYRISIWRDGTVVAYEETLAQFIAYNARFRHHNPEGRWSYEIPPQVATVYTLADECIDRTGLEGVSAHLDAYARAA